MDWDALRVAHIIPETGVELIPNDSYILEAGFDRLNGVSFRKGCYVGQEVTRRMAAQDRVEKRGLVRVRYCRASAHWHACCGGEPHDWHLVPAQSDGLRCGPSAL
ncbi:MAG: tRNA-modifying protein YgfZ [Cypionkella sp.]|nr:tRNA-modifying protein YgfZ [Cypionkella sp.]